MTAARHLRLVETTAEVIPMPHRANTNDQAALAGLRLVADHTVTRRRAIGGWLVRVNGRPAIRPEEIVLDAAALADLIAWLPDGSGDQIAHVTSYGEVALHDQGGPDGGAAA